MYNVFNGALQFASPSLSEDLAVSKSTGLGGTNQ